MSENLIMLDREHFNSIVQSSLTATTKASHLEQENLILKESVKCLKVENIRLKEVLKSCKEFFDEENPKDFTVMSERMDELSTRINEVLK